MSNLLSFGGKAYIHYRFYGFVLTLLLFFIILCFFIYDGIRFKYRYNVKTNKECNNKKKCEKNEMCKSKSCYIKDSKKTQELKQSFISFMCIFVLIGFYYLAKYLRDSLIKSKLVTTGAGVYGGYQIAKRLFEKE